MILGRYDFETGKSARLVFVETKVTECGLEVHDVVVDGLESVSWIVCKRLGIHNPSEGYLAGYIDKSETVSYISEQVSVERIMAAANEIERMLNVQNYRTGLLYKHCDDFKKFCRMLSQEKEKSSTRII